MTPEQFCYWLQGLMEGRGEGAVLTAKEVQIVRDHLATVFTKVTSELTYEEIEAEKRKQRRDSAHERLVTAAAHANKRIC